MRATAGGFSGPAATYAWTVGTTAPALTAKPAAQTAATSATFTFTQGTYTGFECRLDGAVFTACNSGTVTYPALANGTHAFSVRGVDSDGAATATQAYAWIVDPNIPVIAIGSCTGGAGHRNVFAGTTSNTTGTVTLKLFAGTGIAGALAATFTNSTLAGGTWSTSTSNNQLTPGATYTVQATQVDALGGPATRRPARLRGEPT